MLYQHGRAKGKTWWAESGTMRVSFPPIGLPSVRTEIVLHFPLNFPI